MPSSGTIDIFLRCRPTKRPTECLKLEPEGKSVSFHIPRDEADGFINNQREDYEFRFNNVFGMLVKQDEVFERVARPALDNALEGYNATVFAYGQTASGKTFTITGGAERYDDRGLIPRSLQYIYSMLEARESNITHQVYISYLEIYQNTGYDLLDESHDSKKALEDLPRVSLREEENGSFHMHNLSQHLAATTEDALNMLFLGDTNRMVCETPMNMASSRSHCIFTITIVSQKEGSHKVKKSKLNLVDLAGSERVYKTGIGGQLLTEAKYINLSLHFLEGVIVALNERQRSGRTHIPYRDSFMTCVLRDSLGGNCKTALIATISVEHQNVDESISTCRFAQRVALIQNKAVINEETDPHLVIQQLREQAKALKREVALVTGSEDHGPLVESEKERLYVALQSYVDSPTQSPDTLNAELINFRRVHAACAWFKRMILEAKSRSPSAPPIQEEEEEEEHPLTTNPDDRALIRKLRVQLQQRDSEISILVSMLKRKEANRRDIGSQTIGSVSMEETVAPQLQLPQRPASRGTVVVRAPSRASSDETSPRHQADRGKAFQAFRAQYEHNDAIEENKSILKEKYDEAKSLAQQVATVRKRINSHKALMEQLRIERAMQGRMPEGEAVPDPEEERLKTLIDKERAKYKSGFVRLKELKVEIEHLQLLLEKARVRMQAAFEMWYLRKYVEPSAPSGSKPPVPDQRARLAQLQKERELQQQPTPPKPKAAPLARSKSEVLQTGNAAADADIARFFEAKERLLAKRKK